MHCCPLLGCFGHSWIMEPTVVQREQKTGLQVRSSGDIRMSRKETFFYWHNGLLHIMSQQLLLINVLFFNVFHIIAFSWLLECILRWIKYFSGDSIASHSPNASKPPLLSPLTILGQQLTTLPLKKMSFFSDKEEFRSSATVLGYVAHVSFLLPFF